MREGFLLVLSKCVLPRLYPRRVVKPGAGRSGSLLRVSFLRACESLNTRPPARWGARLSVPDETMLSEECPAQNVITS